MQELDDNALLREYADGNSSEAFATLVARHVNTIYSVALRQAGNPHQAEEITQAVFFILARKAGSLRKGVMVAGWLYQTARLTAITATRSEIRRARREKEALMQIQLNETDSDCWPEIAPLLDTAMETLNETDRHAVVLRFFDGKSMKEVGASLGSSEDAAKMRLSRTMEKLRRFFQKRGANHSAEVLASAISTHSVQPAPVWLVQSIVKGAAAGGSTSVLVNGTLKVMAWTKVKTAALAGSAVLFATALGLDLMGHFHWPWFHANPDIQGAWEGVVLLDYPGVESDESAASTHVVLKFVKTKDGYKATTDWIAMGRKDVPMESVIYHFPSLQIRRNPRDTWNLKINADATQMVWDHYRHFIQPDPVLFLRTTTPDTIPDRLTEEDFAPRGGSDLQGYWKGQFIEGTNADPVDLKIAEQPGGTFRAEADNPMDGIAALPLSMSYQRPLVRFADVMGYGVFQGAISNGGMNLIGSFRSGGKSIPASFQRSDYRAEHAHDAEKDYSFHSPDDLQGHWKGSWNVTLGKTTVAIRFVLDLAKLPDGSYAALLSNLDEFGNDAPVPAVELQYDPPHLRAKWFWKRSYEGVLKDGRITGSWFQGGGKFPLVFERINPANP